MKWNIVIIISLFIASSWAAPRAVTNEDIKDAILSMVQMFRTLTDKLERHELRERQLGEQLKKALSTLDKRGRSHADDISHVKSTLVKLDERLQKLETSLSLSEREKGSYTVDSVQSLMTNVEDILQKSHQRESVLDKDQLNGLEVSITSRLDSISSNLGRLEARALQGTPRPSSDTSLEVFNRLENQLISQQNWQETVLTVLETHEKLIKDLQNSQHSETVSHLVKEIEYMNSQIKSIFGKEVIKLEDSLLNFQKMVNQGNEDIIKSLASNNDIAVEFYDTLNKRYDQMSEDIRSLGNVESVLIQTSDNVIDTKRRIEYGVQQILLEIGDLVKLQGKNINVTMNERFDGISEVILDNQKGGLTNLSSKIETEISQVWRQIGIMYQQLTTSAGALDKLQEQTETYVNGSLHTMDSMEGKVGLITARMTEVDENLNYLLGRFSLVTQEFNQIKSALATALDNIKNSFRSVQEKIEEVGPGPNPISSSPGENNSDSDQILNNL